MLLQLLAQSSWKPRGLELLNSGTILSLIADPDPTQNGFLEELSRALWADLETEGLDWGA